MNFCDSKHVNETLMVLINPDFLLLISYLLIKVVTGSLILCFISAFYTNRTINIPNNFFLISVPAEKYIKIYARFQKTGLDFFVEVSSQKGENKLNINDGSLIFLIPQLSFQKHYSSFLKRPESNTLHYIYSLCSEQVNDSADKIPYEFFNC